MPEPKTLLLALAFLACAVFPALGQSLRNAEDRSLSDAAYLAAGVPSLENSWATADYDAAMMALAKLAKDDPRQLPRLKSQSSNKLFTRIYAYRQSDLREANETAERRAIALDILDYVNSVFKIYTRFGIQKGLSFDDEAAVMSARLIDIFANVLETQRILAEKDPEAAKVLSEMGEPLTAFVAGAVMMVADPSFSGVNCETCVSALERHHQSLNAALPAAGKQAIHGLIEQGLRQRKSGASYLHRIRASFP